MEILFALGVALFFALFFGIYAKPKHFYKIRSAGKALQKLKEITSPQRRFTYLRKVDPFVFEEMILTALLRKGHKITRNKRYTGDGGLDGRAVINGENVFVQAKRYSSHISASDVSSFSILCKKMKAKGLFIHTGKTGKLARKFGGSNSIDIVSGQRMLDLLTDNHFVPCWEREGAAV